MSYFKYEQVADQLKELIKNGTYKAGNRIPVEDELVLQFQVGKQTIRKAVSNLEKAGILKRIQGSGTYVCEQKNEEEEAHVHKLLPVESRTVSLVMMNNNNYVFMDLIRGACDYLMSKGYFLSTIVTDGDYEKERLALQSILEHPSAGVIIEPVKSGFLSVNEDLFRRLSERIPCLFLHVDDNTTWTPHLSLRDRQGEREMVNYLIDNGHTKIGSIFSCDEQTGQNRFRGYIDALQEHHLQYKVNRTIWFEHGRECDLFTKEGCIQIERMLEDVTAVLCHDDRIAFRLIDYLQHKGIRVPEDISVAGYDNSEYALLGLPLSTVTHPGEEYGKRAAKAMLTMTQSSDPVDLLEYEIDPEIIIRDSTAPLTSK